MHIMSLRKDLVEQSTYNKTELKQTCNFISFTTREDNLPV